MLSDIIVCLVFLYSQHGQKTDWGHRIKAWHDGLAPWNNHIMPFSLNNMDFVSLRSAPWNNRIMPWRHNFAPMHFSGNIHEPCRRLIDWNKHHTYIYICFWQFLWFQHSRQDETLAVHALLSKAQLKFGKSLLTNSE